MARGATGSGARSGVGQRVAVVVALVLAVWSGCGGASYDAGRIRRPDVEEAALSASTRQPEGSERTGRASWYGAELHGNRTASGERFDMYAFTAAHRTLPFGTVVRVWRTDTRQSVVVRVNDRGPFAKGRVIDVSWAAAYDLEMVRQGVAPVELEVLRWGDE